MRTKTPVETRPNFSRFRSVAFCVAKNFGLGTRLGTSSPKLLKQYCAGPEYQERIDLFFKAYWPGSAPTSLRAM